MKDGFESSVLIVDNEEETYVTCFLKIPDINEEFSEQHSVRKFRTSKGSLNCEVARTIAHLFYRISENVEKWHENNQMQS